MDLLEVKNLQTFFGNPSNPVRAVDGVTFSVPEGGAVALVGESGCGKSVTALSLARLVPEPPGFYAGGEIVYRGQDVLRMRRADMLALRGKEIAYVFQDPANALNPVITIGRQIRETIRLHRPKADADGEALEILNLAGMPDAQERLRAYPHELSGGMKQRAVMAIALACRPRLLVADEPTTALDVTIQAQLLEHIRRLQRELGMALLLITHNLGIVAGIAEYVNVMYAGRVVESGPVDSVLTRCAHPYTRGLMQAVPRINRTPVSSQGIGQSRLKGIAGTVPHPSRLPPGCKFSDRCPQVRDVCREKEPKDDLVDSDVQDNPREPHQARCWFPVNAKGNHREPAVG
jgi:peptide/nickel transport system ATP-binding protein